MRVVITKQTPKMLKLLTIQNIRQTVLGAKDDVITDALLRNSTYKLDAISGLHAFLITKSFSVHVVLMLVTAHYVHYLPTLQLLCKYCLLRSLFFKFSVKH